MAVNKTELFNNITRFYQQFFRKDTKGKEYLQKQGIYDENIFARFKIGFSNGSLLKAIPSKGQMREQLTQIGILTAEGTEYFYDSVVLPVFSQNNDCIGFIGKNITDNKELYLPDPLSGIFNWQAFQSKEIMFTANVLDALLLIQAGHDNIVPVFGRLNTEQEKHLTTYRPNKVYLLPGLENAIPKLQNLGLNCFIVSLSLPQAKEEIIQAIARAEAIPVKYGDGSFKISNEQIVFEFGPRKYQIMEIDKTNFHRLRVNIRATSEQATHIDTIDLYLSRNRAGFIKPVAELFNIPDSVIANDLSLIIQKLEKMKTSRPVQSNPADSTVYEMSQDEEEEALAFLKSPDILNQTVKHLDILGYVGEESNKKLGYLITISRKLDNPLSGVIISRSGAGKSKLMDHLSELVPKEDLIIYTRLTPQALYYQDKQSLKHKLLIAGEEEGLFGSNYPLRELISSKRLSLGAPIKDPISGKMKTVEYEVEGPIALLFSTTQPSINYENATRSFTLSLDESKEQTEKILQAQLEQKTLDGLTGKMETETIKQLHRNAQRLLKKVAVVNPYAKELTFPSSWLETRREHDKYLSLIEAIAFLHQYQREHKRITHNGKEIAYIEVAIQDIEQANNLLAEIMGISVNELSRPSRELLKTIKAMADEKCRELNIQQKDYKFNRRDVREYTGWSDNQIKAHIKKLEELQYLLIAKGDRGRMYRYELQYEGNGDKKYLFGLADTHKLQTPLENNTSTGARLAKLGMVGERLDSETETALDDKRSKRPLVASQTKRELIPPKFEEIVSLPSVGVKI